MVYHRRRNQEYHGKIHLIPTLKSIRTCYNSYNYLDCLFVGDLFYEKYYPAQAGQITLVEHCPDDNFLCVSCFFLMFGLYEKSS